MRKIPTETKSFQAVRLPLHPARFPHQMDDSTCWQIGWATNCQNKPTITETNSNNRLSRNREILCFNKKCALNKKLLECSASALFRSHLLLVVVDGEPEARQTRYSLLKRLPLKRILALVAAAVQDGGHLALVATHAQQLHGVVLTQLLQAQVLRLHTRGRRRGRLGADNSDNSQNSYTCHRTLNSGSFCESFRSSLLRPKALSMGSSEVMDR